MEVCTWNFVQRAEGDMQLCKVQSNTCYGKNTLQSLYCNQAGYLHVNLYPHAEKGSHAFLCETDSTGYQSRSAELGVTVSLFTTHRQQA